PLEVDLDEDRLPLVRDAGVELAALELAQALAGRALWSREGLAEAREGVTLGRGPRAGLLPEALLEELGVQGPLGHCVASRTSAISASTRASRRASSGADAGPDGCGERPAARASRSCSSRARSAERRGAGHAAGATASGGARRAQDS